MDFKRMDRVTVLDRGSIGIIVEARTDGIIVLSDDYELIHVNANQLAPIERDEDKTVEFVEVNRRVNWTRTTAVYPIEKRNLEVFDMAKIHDFWERFHKPEDERPPLFAKAHPDFWQYYQNGEIAKKPTEIDLRESSVRQELLIKD